MYTDTEDVDCAICKCDMWLYAVVSPACPGKAACTEHANQLGCPRSEQILLYRYALTLLNVSYCLGLPQTVGSICVLSLVQTQVSL